MPTPVRPNVLRMHPYQPGKPIATVKRELGLEHVVKLASNENPYGPSPKAVAAIQQAVQELHLYPDGASYDLRSALAAKFSVPFERIVVGNGSEELIANFGLAFIDSPDDEILTSEHSFPRYDAAADLMACKLVKAPLGKGWRYDLEAMADRLSERTKLVFIANPNNPTGTMVGREELERFVARVPDQTLVVLDEAYFDFAQYLSSGEYPDAREYVLQGRNVVAMRTFSKIFGLAGLRVGYAFVPEYITHAFDRVRAPLDMNSLAQAAGVACLEDEEFRRTTLERNAEGLSLFRDLFESEGCEVTDSFTNFHFVDVKRPCMAVFEVLLARGYITRPCTGYGAPNHLRVSVGTPDENDAFAEAFRAVMRA